MRAADPSGGLEKCWQGKELLRQLLGLAGTDPDRSLIWRRLSDSTRTAPTPRSTNSADSPGPSTPGSRRSSRASTPESATAAPRDTTASSSTSAGSRSASATSRTTGDGYATPAPGDPAGSQPVASSPDHSEEPANHRPTQTRRPITAAAGLRALVTIGPGERPPGRSTSRP